MTEALRSAGPAIFASGATVIAALLTLSVAELNSTASLGPIGALGIAVAMISMLTLLPALLVIAPRGVFWPRVPRSARRATMPRTAAGGAWPSASACAPGASGSVTAVLLLMALGNLNYNDEPHHRQQLPGLRGLGGGPGADRHSRSPAAPTRPPRWWSADPAAAPGGGGAQAIRGRDAGVSGDRGAGTAFS